MAKEIGTVFVRSRSTILQDAVGAVALLAMLYAALSLPGMV